MTAKLENPISGKCTITLLTGLHIGGSNDGLRIGGIDNSVVKNPITGEPYIPGSSIKGKMRAILEMIHGEYSDDYGPSDDLNSIISKVFGANGEAEKISSRIIFSDFEMTKEYKDKFKELGSVNFMEDKAENNVPRFGKGNATPRHLERVPAGVVFEGTITFTPVYGGDYSITANELKSILEEGKKYLEEFGLGGGVSRGNGRIKFEIAEELKK